MRRFVIAAFSALTAAGGGSWEADSTFPQSSTAPAPAARVAEPFPHLRVRVDERIVEIAGAACLDAGWLEQIVCTPGTREHEALVVTEARPSEVHAALLMAGLVAGSPGRWVPDGDTYKSLPPNGSAVAISFRWTDPASGTVREAPAAAWIRDHHGRKAFPDTPWVFGGSRFVEIPAALRRAGDPAEVYAADISGSVIGLVTFGEEVIGYGTVLADEVAFEPAEWEVNPSAVPPIGTPVTVIVAATGVNDARGGEGGPQR